MRRINPSLRRGGILIYCVIAMVALAGICSLAVDLARLQMVKTSLQGCADATSRGALGLYSSYDRSTAQAYAPLLAGMNPVDSASNISPTVTVTWGKWDAASRTFTAGTYDPPAVKVVASRTLANQNSVPLTWGRIVGKMNVDVSATSVSMVVNAASGSVTINGRSDPWLAGMPAGSTASYDDTTANASPYPVTSISVTPGSYITLTNVSGTVAHDGSTAYNATGGPIYSHGIDSPGGPTPAAENGIADAVMPMSALLGVFMDSNHPNTTAAPARRDYSTAASQDQPAYNDILLKQPFFIGDGRTSGGAVQQFRVPPGATRLFLGVMDGYEWKNNTGSFAATINVISTTSMVQ